MLAFYYGISLNCTGIMPNRLIRLMESLWYLCYYIKLTSKSCVGCNTAIAP